MTSPENHSDLELLRQSVISKAQSKLGEPQEYYSVLFDGEGWFHKIALAIRGNTC